MHDLRTVIIIIIIIITLHVLRTGVTTKLRVLTAARLGEWSRSLTHTSISWSVVSEERRIANQCQQPEPVYCCNSQKFLHKMRNNHGLHHHYHQQMFVIKLKSGNIKSNQKSLTQLVDNRACVGSLVQGGDGGRQLEV